MYRWSLNLGLVALACATASALFGFGAIPSGSRDVAMILFIVFAVVAAIGLGAARLAHIRRQDARRDAAWCRDLLPPFISGRKDSPPPVTRSGASP